MTRDPILDMLKACHTPPERYRKQEAIMGTRHLIAVIQDGTHKIAQYGQWDGYPEGVGTEVLEFLEKVDLPVFAERVRGLHFVTEEELHAINEQVGIEDDAFLISLEQAAKKKALAAQLSRDTSSDVLGMVERGEVEFVEDAYSFAADSLFCEYAYVIDLDTERFEAYRGFQTEPHNDGRFVGLVDSSLDYRTREYYPVRLVASWPLSALPDNQELIAEFMDQDDKLEAAEEEEADVPTVPDLTPHIYDTEGNIQ